MLSDDQLAELERIRGWACCLEPERRFMLEVENAALKREIQGLKAFLGGIKALLSERYQPTVIADRIDALLADI